MRRSNGSIGQHVSPGAQHLLGRLLEANAHVRISAASAHRLVWVQEAVHNRSGVEVSVLLTDRLLKFSSMLRLKQLAMSCLVQFLEQENIHRLLVRALKLRVLHRDHVDAA